MDADDLKPRPVSERCLSLEITRESLLFFTTIKIYEYPDEKQVYADLPPHTPITHDFAGDF